MFGVVLFTLLLSTLPAPTDPLRRCGLCPCSNDRQVLLCAGKGLTFVPTFTAEIMETATILALQRNRIRVLPAGRLNLFSQLMVVDVRDQRTPEGCVSIQGGLRHGIRVTGKFFYPFLQF